MVDADIIRLRDRLSFDLDRPMGIKQFSFVGISPIISFMLSTCESIVGNVDGRGGMEIGLVVTRFGDDGLGDGGD